MSDNIHITDNLNSSHTTPLNVKSNTSSPLPSTSRCSKPKERIEKSPYIEYKWMDVSIKSHSSSSIFKSECSPFSSKRKEIIKDANGTVHSQETLVIYGGKGSGKTTLLDFLSKRNVLERKYDIKGKSIINNMEICLKEMNYLISDLSKDILIETCVSPKEILLFTSKLYHHNDDLVQQENRVKRLISLFKLSSFENDYLAKDNRKEEIRRRRLLSIALYALFDSPILIIDEPTLGLESKDAYEVIKILNYYARIYNKIVIFSISTCPSEVFELIDKIILISEGNSLLFNSSKDLMSYFELLNFPFRIGYNPFEHIDNIISYSSIDDEYILEIYENLKQINNRSQRFEKYIEYLISLYNLNFGNSLKPFQVELGNVNSKNHSSITKLNIDEGINLYKKMMTQEKSMRKDRKRLSFNQKNKLTFPTNEIYSYEKTKLNDNNRTYNPKIFSSFESSPHSSVEIFHYIQNKKQNSSFYYSFYMLLIRHILIMLRAKSSLFYCNIQYILGLILIELCFYESGDSSESGLKNIFGMLNFISVIVVLIGYTSTCEVGKYILYILSIFTMNQLLHMPYINYIHLTLH